MIGELDEDRAAALAGPDVASVEDARTVEAVSGEDAAVAAAEAEAAERTAGELEHQAFNDAGIDPTRVLAAKEASRFARMRAALVRRRAERAAQAARLLALAEVGTDVDKVAAAASGPDAALAKAAQAIAQACGRLRELTAAHDRQVRDLVARARELHAEPPAPSGPRASSAHVTVAPGGESVTHGCTKVRIVGAVTTDAIAAAVAGDPDKAVQLVAAVHEQAVPTRPPHHYIRGDGRVFATSKPDDYAVRTGALRPMTPAEVDRYYEGRLA